MAPLPSAVSESPPPPPTGGYRKARKAIEKKQLLAAKKAAQIMLPPDLDLLASGGNLDEWRKLFEWRKLLVEDRSSFMNRLKSLGLGKLGERHALASALLRAKVARPKAAAAKVSKRAVTHARGCCVGQCDFEFID